VMMPFISFFSCILIGWIVGPKWISDEMESSGHTFKRKRLYNIMIKYIAPVLMLILALQSIGILDVLLG
ncbi:MAG: sodium-dependent transporter, partial [Clostridiales bacterium]|nr:sodium-dependent transporter [Clostridiales bacterium]